MKPLAMLSISIGLSSILLCGRAGAHVPYIEGRDFSFEQPFIVTGSPEKSIAVYSWLQSGDDIDVFRMTVTSPVRLYCSLIVPVCPAYAGFLPSLAVAGPGLPEPGEPLPFDLPEGFGAVVIHDAAPGAEREQFYEPFSGKSYYQGPEFDQPADQAGAWHLYAWDPYGAGGDYVAVIGFEERFSPVDFFRSLINTVKVRMNRELHTDCRQGG